jgi:hypothetical protein
MTLSVIPRKAAYGPKVIESVCPNEKTMGGTKQNGILKGDQRL